MPIKIKIGTQNISKGAKPPNIRVMKKPLYSNNSDFHLLHKVAEKIVFTKKSERQIMIFIIGYFKNEKRQ